MRSAANWTGCVRWPDCGARRWRSRAEATHVNSGSPRAPFRSGTKVAGPDGRALQCPARHAPRWLGHGQFRALRKPFTCGRPFAVLVGAWVDRRVGKRALMVAADVVRAVLLLTVPAAALLGLLSLGQLYAVALLTGLAGVVFTTAYPSFFTRLVPASSYVDANSKLSASRSLSFVAGPALGGGLVQLLTAPVALAADALSFLASALFIGPIRVPEPPAARTGRTRLMSGAREGLAHVVRHPVLRAGLGCATTVNFFTFLTGTGLLVLFADRDLGLSPGLIGMVFGLGAVGGLLGAVGAPAISRLIGVGRSIAVGAVLFPAPLALVWAAQGPL
ncbi:MFS transporter [Streptomyces collinus]|uniref:MFS transporter n=1 Tax=Streptomyces collinus TaxID=42684 RepID=UPI0029431032|nr:MFS transporter [Streptomyces collinus]